MILGPAEAARLFTQAAKSGVPAAVAVAVGGTRPEVLSRRIAVVGDSDSCPPRGSLGDAELDDAVIRVLRAFLRGSATETGLLTVDTAQGEVELYVEARLPPPELIIVGAGHVARPLAQVADIVGFRVTVLDDRPGFATSERFPVAVRVLTVDFDRPFRDVNIGRHSHIILVTRGHRYDYACLTAALSSPDTPAYIGMIGSRRRVRATYLQLVDDGFDAARLSSIHAPIGLDVGAETPEEIAVAVAAELVLVRRGGSGQPLHKLERVAERFFSSTPGTGLQDP